MIKLKDKIRKNGFDYTLELRGNKCCIYKQWVSENVFYFEVFRVKVKKERTLLGKTFPECEIFPNDEAFGYWAWSCRTLEEAKVRFNSIESSIVKLEKQKSANKFPTIDIDVSGQYNLAI